MPRFEKRGIIYFLLFNNLGNGTSTNGVPTFANSKAQTIVERYSVELA